MFLSAGKLLIRCWLHYSVKRSLRCNHSITELITILIGQTLSLKFCNPIPLLLEMAKRWKVLKLTTTRSACLCLSPYISNCQSVLKSPQQPITTQRYIFVSYTYYYADALSSSAVAFSALATLHCLLAFTFSYFRRNGGISCPAFLAITTKAGEHSLS